MTDRLRGAFEALRCQYRQNEGGSMNSQMLALWGQGYSAQYIARAFATTIEDVQVTLRSMGVMA
jgi:hypothetical protein